jgi:hypothetical protein
MHWEGDSLGFSHGVGEDLLQQEAMNTKSNSNAKLIKCIVA